MKQYLIIITGFVLVVVALFCCVPMANGFTLSNGKALLAFYIPLPACTALALYFLYTRHLNYKTALIVLGSFLLLMLPFAPLWWQSYHYLPQDDGYRYHLMANHIAQTGNLWGADDLVFGTDRKVFLFQPGYKYYVAGWLALAGEENRLFQLSNMLLFISSLLLFLAAYNKFYNRQRLETGWLLFILLSSPFVVKLILMGLSEWLLISLFLLAFAALLQKKNGWATVILALIPFVRQNLVMASVLIIIWLYLQQQINVKGIIAYVVILLLPLYHNLYYAGEWKWLSTYSNSYGYLTLYPGDSVAMQWIKTMAVKLFSYAGIHPLQGFASGVLIALLFIPLGSLLYVMTWRVLKGKERWWFVAISLSALLPTLLLGGQSYYPRFEWVNLFVAGLVYLLICSRRSFAQQKGIGQNQTT